MTICLLWSLAQADGKPIIAVEQQSLTGALTQFAEQTGLQLVYPSRLTADIEVAAAAGETPEHMLEQLLAGTNLMYEYLNANTITLMEKPKPEEVNTMSHQANSINNPSPRPSLFKRITTLIVGATLASTAIAADETTDEDKPGMEEIIVTATYRDTRLMDTPLAISAVTSEDIMLKGIEDIQTLYLSIPGLSYRNSTQTYNLLTVRGLTPAPQLWACTWTTCPSPTATPPGSRRPSAPYLTWNASRS